MALRVCARPLAILLCRQTKLLLASLPPPPPPLTASYNKTRWNDQLPDHPSFSFSLRAFHLCPSLASTLSLASIKISRAARFNLVTDRKKRKKRIDTYRLRPMSHGTLEPAGLMAPGAEMILSFSPVNRYRITGHWMFGGSYESLFWLVQLVGRI